MGKKSGQGRRAPARDNGQGPKRFFVTSEGVEIKIRPVSDTLRAYVQLGALRKLRDEGEPVDPPVYMATTVADEKIELTLDADSLEIPGDEKATNDNKERWVAHVAALERVNEAQQNALMRLFFQRGMIIEEREGWEEDHREFNIEIPEDPKERRAHYILTEVLHTPADMATMAMAIMRLSKQGSVNMEMLDAAEATFRSSLQETETEDQATKSADPGESVDVQPETV